MSDPGVIVAVGIGAAGGVPDRVRVMVGVSTVAESVGEAMSDAAAAQDRLIEAAMAAGVDRSSIQTAGYNVGRDYEAGPVPSRYRADAGLALLLPDMTAAAAVLGSMSDAAGDAFRIHFVRPELSDTEAARRTARADAVRAARRQAEELAGAAGVELGRLRSLVEDTGGGRIPFTPMGARTVSAAAPGIEGGTLDSTVVVTATYEVAEAR